MALSCIVSEIKRGIGRKSQFFHIPALPFSALPALHSPSEYCHNFWYEKTKMVWLPDGQKSLMIRLAISTHYRRVTDRRTDIHFATA